VGEPLRVPSFLPLCAFFTHLKSSRDMQKKKNGFGFFSLMRVGWVFFPRFKYGDMAFLVEFLTSDPL